MHCVLISLHPQYSQATYFDSHRHVKKKDYTRVKEVLDDALAGFRHRIGTKLDREFVRRGSPVFNHKTDFPCVTQPEDSPREAFFTIMFMREMVRDVVEIDLPDKMLRWRQNLCDTSDPQAIPAEFGRIQQKIATTIQRDVVTKEGIFFQGLVPMSNDEIDSCLQAQCDDRPFMTRDSVLPFPEKQPLTEKLAKEKVARKQKKK